MHNYNDSKIKSFDENKHEPEEKIEKGKLKS
jgi:hypothetical protein